MDAEQFAQFMAQQKASMKELINSFKGMTGPAAAGGASGSVAGASAAGGSVNVPLPPPLELEGDMERNYNFFEKNWNNYASAVGMDTWSTDKQKQKTSVLLSVIGQAALKKYYNFELTEAQQGDPKLALAEIKSKVVRVRNQIVDWVEFFSMEQWKEESIDDYVGRLKALAKICRFGALEVDMVKFKIVTSNKWSHLRASMLTAQNLTEARAIDMCRAEEVSERHRAAGGSCVVVNKLRKKTVHKCKFCGSRHEFAKGVCPALGRKCNRCGGKNHFEKVCKVDRKKRFKKKVNEVCELSSGSEETSEESDSDPDSSDSATIGKIYDKSRYGGHVLADLDLFVGEEWTTVQCELDTGANASLVGRDWLTKMTGLSESSLLPSRCQLQSFGGGHIPVLGEVKVPCRHNGRKYKLLLQVVDVQHGPLLSANVCKKLGFVKFCDEVSVSVPRRREQLMEIHSVKAQEHSLMDNTDHTNNRSKPEANMRWIPRKEPCTPNQDLVRFPSSKEIVAQSDVDSKAISVGVDCVSAVDAPKLLKLKTTTEIPTRLKRKTTIFY